MPAADGAYEDALAALSDQKLRSAAISAQLALRDAVTASDWVAEERARRALATILIESDEPALAARHLARAGGTKAVETLGKSLPREFIDVLDDLNAPNYWTVGTIYRLLATQADLIPDDLVGTVSEHVLGELVAAETGSRPDLRAFATSRYNNAVKALAGIADRLDATHANNALSHFKKQPLVEENHYRYHDEDVAVVVAKIALTHAPLAARAIPHLVSLLGRSQGARNSTTLDAIDKNRPLAHEALTALAGAGNRWASETLSFEDPKDLDAGVADEALARLTTPLIHTDGVYSVGTNAIGDSLLVRHLSSDAIDTAITELLVRADDPHVSSSDRGEYLVAAATSVATLPSPSETNSLTPQSGWPLRQRLRTTTNSNEQFTHKLGGFRMNGTPRDSRGQQSCSPPPSPKTKINGSA